MRGRTSLDRSLHQARSSTLNTSPTDRHRFGRNLKPDWKAFHLYGFTRQHPNRNREREPTSVRESPPLRLSISNRPTLPALDPHLQPHSSARRRYKPTNLGRLQRNPPRRNNAIPLSHQDPIPLPLRQALPQDPSFSSQQARRQ